MASAVRVHAAERGEAISEYAMIAFGGAAPTHAATVAEKVGINRVVIPANAGVGSAVGFLEAPISFELVRSMHMPLAEFDRDKAEALLQAMSVEARHLLAAKPDGAAITERRMAFMRYVGQGHEVGIAFPSTEEVTTDTLRAAFETEYGQLFSRAIPGAAIEILNWSVLITADRSAGLAAASAAFASSGPTTTRRIFDGGNMAWLEVPVLTRGQLADNGQLAGPAIVIEAETSTFVPASFDVSVDDAGFIIMQRKAA